MSRAVSDFRMGGTMGHACFFAGRSIAPSALSPAPVLDLIMIVPMYHMRFLVEMRYQFLNFFSFFRRLDYQI